MVELPFAVSGGDTGFLIELGIVLSAMALLARFASRIGISPIPLYLLAGLAFGEGGLVPLGLTEDFIELGANIGVILLLFMLGLEYSSHELRDSLKSGLPAGAVDLVLNFTPGVVFGLLLGWGVVASLVLGGITYISSSGVISKVLSDLGRLGNRETPSILSMLVMEDLAMVVYLPLIAVLVTGSALLTASLSLILAMAAASLALLVAFRYGGHISRALVHTSDEVVLLSVLGVILLVAGISEELNVSSAVGAFLVGIALSDQVEKRARELLAPLRDLFAASFFLFFGLEINPSAIPPVLLLAVLLSVATAASKIYTGWWAARRAGASSRGRLRAGFTMVARGEFSILIAKIAIAAAIEPKLGPLAAAYVLILAVLGPILARLADPIASRLWRKRVVKTVARP